MKLKNKTIVITGGANGLGKMISDFFLKKNFNVVIIDINKKALDNFDKSLNLLRIQCDLTKEKEISKSLKKIKNKFSKIDVLINNAGIIHNEPIINLTSKRKRHSPKKWKKIIEINLTAPFILTTYVAEHMIINRTKGLIINVSSICAKGNIGQSAYSAAKAGLESITAVTAKELGVLGIRCVAIAPGFIDTGSTKSMMNKNLLQKIEQEIPLKKLGKSKDIVQAIMFLIENEYINGKVLQIDGGMVL